MRQLIEITLDALCAQKFGLPFFRSLEDLSEESQRVHDLTTPARNNAEYLYRICILSGVIDHLNLRLEPEDDHQCSECHQRHRPVEGSLQGFRKWLANKFDDKVAVQLTTTFQMVKNLRKQYPIHDHYITANNIRQIRKEIEEANQYFGIRDNDFGFNAAAVISKFTDALDQIATAIQTIQ